MNTTKSVFKSVNLIISIFFLRQGRDIPSRASRVEREDREAETEANMRRSQRGRNT